MGSCRLRRLRRNGSASLTRVCVTSFIGSLNDVLISQALPTPPTAKVTSLFHTFQPTLTPTGFTSTLITSPTSSRPIYLDMQATTPMDPRVLAKMVPYFLEQFGNPHSRTHVYGWETEKAVEEARG